MNMNKQKQLIEYIVQDVIAFIIEDKSVELEDAMNQFYNSTVFEKLQDIETGLYLESSAYIYDMFKIEIKNGRLIQKEL